MILRGRVQSQDCAFTLNPKLTALVSVFHQSLIPASYVQCTWDAVVYVKPSQTQIGGLAFLGESLDIKKKNQKAQKKKKKYPRDFFGSAKLNEVNGTDTLPIFHRWG